MPNQTSSENFELIMQAESDKGNAVNYNDELAKSESKDKFEDHKRAVSYKKHLHSIVIIGLWVIGIIIISFVCIRAWHLAAPECVKWLSESQLHTIDTVLFSSVIFSLASRYFSYYKLFQSKE